MFTRGHSSQHMSENRTDMINGASQRGPGGAVAERGSEGPD